MLHVPSVGQVMGTLKTFDHSSAKTNIPPASEPDPARAMSYCTSSAPHKLLNDREIHMVQRICDSIEGLEKVTRMVEGQAKLYQHLGPRVAKAMVEFWEDEWIV